MEQAKADSDPLRTATTGTALLSVLACAATLATSAMADELFLQFADPPPSARPQVWWHWMNGRIDPGEAVKDLAWLHEVGVGGVQVFEAGLGPAAPEDIRVVYGSAAWKAALAASARTAMDLGLEFAITTAPGWSATGGPWVAPRDAMKKLVWSRTLVQGGQRIAIRLVAPPRVAGPYQDIPAGALGGDHGDLPEYYRDIVTLAVPARSASPVRFSITAEQPPVGMETLQDGRFWPPVELSADGNGELRLLLTCDEPTTVGAVTLGQPGRRGFGSPEPPAAELQYSQNGIDFHTVIGLPATSSPVRSASFAPVTAPYYRLVLAPGTEPAFLETLDYAPGAVRLKLPARSASYAVSEIVLHADARIHAAEEKAGFAAATDYYAIATPTTLPATAPAGAVLDISGRVARDGLLEWDAPPGPWQVIRLGFSLTGHENGPAPREATGLEVDKLSAARVAGYLDAYLATYSDDDGELYEGITGLLSDSIESGPQNWTEDLPDRFRELRGYDPLPWLATVTGEIIDSPEASDRFLWDFRHTISELLTTEHYGTIAQAARSRGLTYYAEALEDHRPQLGNDLEIRARADVPMAAFWHYPADRPPKATYLMDVKGAASVAHVYGKPLVAVEAMTTFGFPWAVGPRELKIAADRAFVTGANRLMLHSSVHQAGGKNFTPGQSMMPLLGHYFNRNETWAELARPWMDYLSRTQFLLQQGRFAAEFAYFIGEEAPATGLFGDRLPEGIPAGFDYDFIAAGGLEHLAVTGGRIHSRSGTEYRFLYLGGTSRRMTMATLRRLNELAGQGALVFGRRPAGSPSLADSDAEFDRLARETWALSNVTDAGSPAEAIAHLQMQPAWRFSPDTPADGAHGSEILAVHARALPGGLLYFVVNTTADRVRGTLAVPVASASYRPELWHAVSGVRHAPKSWDLADGTLRIELTLEPHEALFVVPGSQESTTGAPHAPAPADSAGATAIAFDGDWGVEFDQRYGEVPALSLPALTPLEQHPDERVRHYSGITTYRNSFTVSDANAVGTLQFSLAGVGDIAEVRVNGEYAGSLWTPPYSLDIAPWLKTGENRITITVANLWVNRLIGLAKAGRSPGGFPANVYRDDAPLRPAGLIGPATLTSR